MSDITNTTPSPDSSISQQPEEEDRRRRAAAFWWWRIGAGVLAAAIALGLLFYFGGLARKRSAEKQKVDHAFVFRIDGKDKQGRNAAFDFIVLTNDYTWVKGSADQVESNGQAVPDADVAERVLTKPIRDSLSAATDLIAVGLASQEGEKSAEEARANLRSRTIAVWMGRLGNPATPIWNLSLGQYNRECKKQEDADTSFERPLILVGVRSKDAGADLKEALSDAVSGRDNLPSQECYSQFELTKVR